MIVSGRIRGIVANVTAERHLRVRAKVWVTMPWTGGGLERLEVRGISKGGRIIRKWVARKALRNFRFATVPPHLEADVVTWTEPEDPPRWATFLVNGDL